MTKLDAYSKSLVKKKKKFDSGIDWEKVWSENEKWSFKRPMVSWEMLISDIQRRVENQLKPKKVRK